MQNATDLFFEFLEGRPIVFFDFETSGLTDADRPCEIAAIVMSAAGGADPSDPDVATVLGLLPVHLHRYVSMVMHGRCHPGVRIKAGAQAIHGISDADVAGAPRFDDFSIVEMFRGLESAGAAWAGHNIIGFDLRMAARCGYLAANSAALVFDTMAIFASLKSYAPGPRCPEYFAPDDSMEGALYKPLIGEAHPLGLKAFAGSLEALHLALTGAAMEGAHGALADTAATVRVFDALINGWTTTETRDAWLDDLRVMLKPPPGYVGSSGWLKAIVGVDGDAIDYEIQKGKARGYELSEADRGLVKWIADLPDCDDATRAVLISALNRKPDDIPF